MLKIDVTYNEKLERYDLIVTEEYGGKVNVCATYVTTEMLQDPEVMCKVFKDYPLMVWTALEKEREKKRDK